jgi:hypothetical protein
MSNRPATVSTIPPGKHTLVSKAIVCEVEANCNPYQAAEIAEKRCPGLSVLPRILHEKANVGAMPLTSADPYGFRAETFLALIAGVLRALLERFIRVPVRTKLPAENSAGGVGAWVGEGLPTPVVKTTTTAFTLEAFKFAVITVLTKVLARHGGASESTLLRMLRDDNTRFLLTALFDSTISGTAARCASLTWGANRVTQSGVTAAAIVTDLTALIALIQSPMVDMVWAMRPATFYKIAATLAGVGLPVTKDNLFGIPVLLFSAMPREVVLIDCAGIYYGGDEQTDLQISTEATLEMQTAPTESGISGVGAAQVSLYQAELIAIQATTSMGFGHAYFGLGSPTVPASIAFMLTTY